MLKRIIPLLLFALLALQPAKAQFFVESGGYCPEGEGVEADTILYTHNKAMPFDRCFTLKYVLKGEHEIKYFTINPIDKYGNVKIRKRDYRVFLKSGYPDKEKRKQAAESLRLEKRKQAADNLPLNKRQPIISRLHKVSKSIMKGKNTEVILKVPPLDPGRNYKITLISNDLKAVEDLFEVGELIFKSELDSVKADSLRAEAIMHHNQSLYQRDTNFHSESLENFQKHLYSFKIIFNHPNETNQDTKDKNYRIFFTPITPKTSGNLTLATAFKLDPSRYLFKNPSRENPLTDPDTIKVVPKLINENGDVIAGFNDTQGNSIVLNRDSAQYKVSLLVIDKNKPVSYHELGEFRISPNGTNYSTTLDPKIADGLFFKIEPSPLNKYSLIIDAEESITKIVNKSFDRDGLRFLMKQTLNALDKGLIDTTAKDNLIRSLAVLFEQNPSDLKNIQIGLVSLKEPNKVAKENQYKLRKENIKSSIEQVNLVQDFINKVKIFDITIQGH